MTATTTRTVQTLLALRRDATLDVGADGKVELIAGFRRARLGVLPPPSRLVVQRLAEQPAAEGELLITAGGTDAGRALFAVSALLQQLRAYGWIDEQLVLGNRHLLGVHPHVAGRPRVNSAAVSGVVQLSRFAHLRREGDSLLLDSPEAQAVVTVQDRAVAALMHDLIRPRRIDELELPELRLDVSSVTMVLRTLAGAGLLTELADGADPQVEQPRWRQWSFHDRLFHARSRAGRTSAGYGGTRHLADELVPLPPVEGPRGAVVGLPPVDLASGAVASASFGAVLESRRSVRAHDDEHPITVAQLGELLYRTVRQRGVLPGADGEDCADRPYPSGGALYELDFYPVVTNCAGLEPGVYRYLADTHSLELIDGDAALRRTFVDLCARTGLFEQPPQVVLMVTGRFGRVMRKYESMPYALMLKHVGVVYQSWYLTATAMGLAACGIGGGDSDQFAALTGRDPLVEGALGEFLLGSMA